MNFMKLQTSQLITCLVSKRQSSFLKSEFKVIKRFTQQDLDTFSQLTGDLNYVHSSDITKEKRKVHGAFLNAIVTGILGTQYPGTIVLEQTFTFPKPCRVEVDCEFLLKFLQERKISIILYECKQNNVTVFKGQAKLLFTNNKN